MKSHKLFLVYSLGLLLTACSPYPYGNRNVVEEQYVHQYGVEVDSNDWVQRGQNGQVISTLKNGVVIAKSYSQGIQHGETTYTFPHNQSIEKVETYQNGTLVKGVKNDMEGNPLYEVEYTPDRRKIITTWFENGLPQSREEYKGNRLEQGEYYTYDNKMESQLFQGTGLKVLRNFHGELLAKEDYLNGQVVMRSTYFSSGAPKEQISIQNGVAHGPKKIFNPDGEPTAIEEWDHGVHTGITTVFKNGEKYAEVPYVNGVKNGIEKRFKSGDIVVQEVTWKDNIQHGPMYSYIGGKSVTDWYFQGRQISKSQFDMMSQSPRAA